MPLKRGKRRVHRLVVLPDYQGCGIGTEFITAVAKIEEQNGFELSLVTTTPALVYALKKRNDWLLVRADRSNGYKSMKAADEGYEAVKHLTNAGSNKRITFSFWHKKEAV